MEHNQTTNDHHEEVQPQQPSMGMSPIHEAPPDLKHSGLGIASFIIGLLSIVLGITGFVIMIGDMAGMLNQFSDDFGSITEQQAAQIVTDYPGMLTGTLLLMFTAFLMLVGAILGMVGLFQQRKKIFPILGTCINALPIVLFIFFAIIGAIIG